MSCNKELAERLIKITGGSLLHYNGCIIDDGDYHYLPDYQYSLHTFVWEISSKKFLSVRLSNSNSIYTFDAMYVTYKWCGIPYWRSHLDFHDLPDSVKSTIIQFALDEMKVFIDKQKSIDTTTKCEDILQQLS